MWLQLNDAPLAIVDKRRSSHNVSEVMNLIGDVKGKVAVLVDDMIDTAGTITNAAKVCLDSLQPTSCSASRCFVHVISKRMQSAVYRLRAHTDIQWF